MKRLPHVHSREEEGFYVIEGKFSFQYNGEVFTVEKGAYLHLPMGIVHSFKNSGNAAGKLLITIVPGGLEKFFAEAGVEIVDEKTFSPPPDPSPETMNHIAAKYGLTFVPPLK